MEVLYKTKHCWTGQEMRVCLSLDHLYNPPVPDFYVQTRDWDGKWLFATGEKASSVLVEYLVELTKNDNEQRSRLDFFMSQVFAAEQAQEIQSIISSS